MVFLRHSTLNLHKDISSGVICELPHTESLQGSYNWSFFYDTPCTKSPEFHLEVCVRHSAGKGML